jgi:mono/diheme cytochrome c family protein
MTLNKIKLIAIAFFTVPMLALTFSNGANVGASPAPIDDSATVYKAKCAMCHGANAAKFFDTSLSDDELVQAILKGKKGEKPPNMPAFEEKGINAEQAKELVAYMKQLKSAGN